MTKTIVSLGFIFILGIAAKLFFLNLPSYQVVYFDEAITGLMAIHMLQGEMPIFYWGCPYLGPLEAFVAFIFFVLFGVSTIALRFSPLVFYVIYAVFLFLLSKRIEHKDNFNFYLFIYLIFPPFYLNHFSITPIGDYIHVVALGTVLMFVTLKILDKKSVFRYAFLGLLSGFSFWTFLLTVPYIAACYVFLFIKEKKVFFSRSLVISGLGFIFGSLPFWIWNLKNGFLTFSLKAESASSKDIIPHARHFYHVLQLLCGKGDNYILLFFLLFYGMISVIIFQIIRYRKQFVLSLLRPGLFLLSVLMFIFMACFYIFSAHGRLALPRYLLPLYSVIPLGICFLLDRVFIGNKGRLLGVLVILGLNFPSNLSVIRKELNPQHIRPFTPDKQELSALLSFLREKKITNVYGPYFLTQILTFESKESVVAADFSGFRNLDYLKQVDISDSVAIVVQDYLNPPTPDTMEQTIGLLTEIYKKEKIGRFHIFYDFYIQPVEYQKVNKEIKDIQGMRNEVFSVINDNNLSTYWKSQASSSFQEFYVSFKKSISLAKISLLPGPERNEFPKNLNISGSLDGINWFHVKSFSSNAGSFLPFKNRPRLFGKGQTDVILEKPLEIKFLKFFHETNAFPWSVSELFVYERKGENKTLSIDTIKKICDEHSFDMVYTDPEINLCLHQINNSSFEVVPMYPKFLTFMYWSRVWNQDDQKRQLDYSLSNAFIVSSSKRAEIEFFLSSRDTSFDVFQYENVSVIITKPECVPEKELEPFNWHLTKENESYYVQKDLQHEHKLKGWFFHSRNMAENFSRISDWELKVSNDRIHWAPVQFFHKSNAYWTDQHLVAFLQKQESFVFSHPVSARYIAFFPKKVDSRVFPFDGVVFFKDSGDGFIKTALPEHKSSDFQAVFFEKKVKLSGFSVSQDLMVPGEILHLIYDLSILKSQKNDFAIFVHFVTPDGKILFQNDHSLFEGTFNEKQVIKDEQFIRVPQIDYEGSVRIVMGIWNPKTGRRWNPGDKHLHRCVVLKEMRYIG